MKQVIEANGLTKKFGQVTALEIFFQRHAGMKIHLEAMISVTLLSLGTGQCIFLAIFGVQKNRERCADLFETLVQHFIRCAADHNPIALSCPQAQKSVAYSTAHQVGFNNAHRRGCRRKDCNRR